MGLILDPNKELFDDLKTDNPIGIIVYFIFLELDPPKRHKNTNLCKLSYFERAYIAQLIQKYGEDYRVYID